MEFFEKLFDTDFMPHGHCYFWDPAIVWTNAISDSLTALAYFTIPFTLLHIVRVRKDLNFTPLILLFAVFILSCGATHIMDVINIWSPLYRLDSSLRAITAIASTATAFMLVRITPQILTIPNSNQYQKLNEELKAQITLLKERDQTIELLKKNRELETVIAESEARFKLIFDNSLASIVVSDDQGNYLSANKAAADLFGYEVNEILQMNVADLKTAESQETTRRFEDYISKGEETGEFDFITKNGAHKFVQYQAVRPKTDFNLSIIMDVTNQKEAQLKLKASEKLLQIERKSLHDFFTQAPAVLAILKGPEHVFEFANPPYMDLTGNRDIINKSLLEALPEMAAQGFIELLDNVYKTGETYNGKETRVMVDRGNGKTESIFMNFTYKAFSNHAGETEGILVFAYDVSEQVIAREQIEESETAMRKMATHLKLATDSANVGTWSLELQTEKLEWSALHKKMWGYNENRTDLTYEDWHALLLPGDKEKAFQKVAEARVSHTPYQSDYYIKRAGDGALRYVRSYGKYHYNEKGDAESLTGISIDITEQKEAELKLKASEEKYRSLFETMDQGFCMIEMIFDEAHKPVDYLFIEANPMFEKHSGIVNPTGKTMRQLVPTIEDRWFQTYGNVSLTGESTHFIDYTEELKRWFEVYAFRLEDQGSNRVAVLFTDITESKKSQQKIAASENQFRTFADSIQNLAWIANGDGWIYWYNKQWYDYTGTTLEEMEGWGWEKVHHPAHIKKFTDFVKQAWGKDEAWEKTFLLRRHDGEYRWFLTRAYPVKDTNGNIEKWIGTNTDVTEQKTFAEELEAKVNERTEALSFKTNQLQELNQILESRNVELDKMNKELESFTYISSHDLQEPLRKIQTFASLIAEKENDNLSTNGKDLFQRMQASAKRMQSLIEDLLAYSRTKSLETNFEKVDLSSVVAIVVSDLKEEIQQKNALIEVNNTCEVNIIPFQFQQLFYNLISNSLKFSNPEKRLHITITTEQSQGSKSDNNELIHGKNYCHIIVADNGIGFEPQYNEKIFELFQRLHGRNEYNGTGIGLAIVKKIVENHHGVVTAKGELGKGATFDIYIPVINQ